MTYKLFSNVEKVLSPLVLIFPNGEKKEYANGKEAAAAEFEQPYGISSLKAVGDKVEIVLDELIAPEVNWETEEEVSFFLWCHCAAWIDVWRKKILTDGHKKSVGMNQ